MLFQVLSSSQSILDSNVLQIENYTLNSNGETRALNVLSREAEFTGLLPTTIISSLHTYKYPTTTSQLFLQKGGEEWFIAVRENNGEGWREWLTFYSLLTQRHHLNGHTDRSFRVKSALVTGASLAWQWPIAFCKPKRWFPELPFFILPSRLVL